MRGLIAEPGIAGSGRERHAQALRERTTWQLEAQPGRHVLTPGAGVRNIRRIGVAAGDTDRVPDASIAADNRLPIVDAVRLAGKPFSGIAEIGHAEVEIDIGDFRANTARHSYLSDRLGRQLDGGHRGTGV